jgi:hypothetical protein
MQSLLRRSLSRLVYSKYTDWDNLWVHYTKEPYIKVNPKAIYRDPAGIYLFPSKFEPAPMWTSFPYKFIVSVPQDLKVLDFATLSRQSVLDIVAKVIGREVSVGDKKNILEEKNFLNSAWETMYSNFYGKAGEFNKKFRSLGYDAIFDDTRTIHSNEIQLLILDPRKLKVIEMQKQTDSGYDDVILIMDYVAELSANFGKVTSKLPRKEKKYGEQKLQGSILVEQGDKYVDLVISADQYPGSDKKARPITIHVSKRYSKPDIGMGAGAAFDRSKRSFKEIEKELTYLFKKVFD